MAKILHDCDQHVSEISEHSFVQCSVGNDI